MQLKFFMLAAIFGCAVASPILEGADIDAGGVELDGADIGVDGADINVHGLEFDGTDIDGRGLDLEMRAPQGDATSTSDAPQVSGSGSAEPDAQRGSGNRGCANRRSTVNFVRKNFPNFRVSTIIGLFFRSRQRGTVALFVIFNRRTGDYIYTLSTRERSIGRSHGYQFQGIAGWVYPDSRCGGSPLFRLWSPKKKQHFYTASIGERDRALRSGYEVEGIIGYVYQK